jgi:hypothetical protein
VPYKDPEKQRAAALKSWHKTAEARRGREPWKRVANVIDDSDRCLWHAARADYCRRKATWHNGQWRACDLHRLRSDTQIAPNDVLPAE